MLLWRLDLKRAIWERESRDCGGEADRSGRIAISYDRVAWNCLFVNTIIEWYSFE